VIGVGVGKSAVTDRRSHNTHQLQPRKRPSVRSFPHPLAAFAIRVSSGKPSQVIVLVHRYVIIDDPAVIFLYRGHNTFKVKVGCEAEFNVDAVFSDSSAAENTKSGWSCRVIGASEQAILLPRCSGLYCVGAKNLPVAPVIVFVTRFEALELSSKSSTEKWPERLLFAAIRNSELLVV
jgi:hypothetical protein